MPKLQCQDICIIEPHPRGQLCCHRCEFAEKCKVSGDICDSWELGIEHCPLAEEVEE